jgi:sulfonate transport system permease protein
MIHTGQLKEDLLISLSRVVKGYLVSAILGIILGSLIGMFRTVKELLLPLITVIRQIPMIAWIPLIILWAGIGEASKVIIIVLAAFFPILVNTESGISGTPKEYLEVAKLYKLNPWKTFTRVYLPHALPQMLVGLKLGLGVSWMAVVASELIAATSGIGYRMSDARSMMRSDIVIICMIVIGLVGVIMDKVIGVIFDTVTPWQKLNRERN